MGVIEGNTFKISEHRPDKLFRGIVNIPREGAEKYFMVPVSSTYYESLTGGVARGHLGSAQVADKQWEAEAIQDGEGPLRLRGGGYSRHGGELEDPPALDFKKTDNTMMIIGGICVAGVLLYVYK